MKETRLEMPDSVTAMTADNEIVALGFHNGEVSLKQIMCVINDPLGQNHHYSHFKFVLFVEILKCGKGRTDTTCENSDYWRS